MRDCYEKAGLLVIAAREAEMIYRFTCACISVRCTPRRYNRIMSAVIHTIR